MIQFLSLGSGSSGNCYYLRCDSTGLLIDAGVGIRHFKKYYKDYGGNLEMIHALLITHDHTDHVKTAGMLAQQYKLPVYATAAVHQGMLRNIKMNKKVPAEQAHILNHGEELTVGPFRITSFAVPHDSSENAGYRIEAYGTVFTIITDAGHITTEMQQAVAQSHYLVLEANYDQHMLDHGPYPAPLRRRIASENGHLCNTDTASLLSTCASTALRRVWLCHLSEENNSPHMALKTIAGGVTEATKQRPYSIEVLQRKLPTGFFDLPTLLTPSSR